MCSRAVFRRARIEKRPALKLPQGGPGIRGKIFARIYLSGPLYSARILLYNLTKKSSAKKPDEMGNPGKISEAKSCIRELYLHTAA
jgi:hypothetical protein